MCEQVQLGCASRFIQDVQAGLFRMCEQVQSGCEIRFSQDVRSGLARMCEQDQSGCESRCPAPSQPHRCHWKQEAERRLATKRCFITQVLIVEVHKKLKTEHVLEVHIVHSTHQTRPRRTHSKRSSTHSTQYLRIIKRICAFGHFKYNMT